MKNGALEPVVIDLSSDSCLDKLLNLNENEI